MTELKNVAVSGEPQELQEYAHGLTNHSIDLQAPALQAGLMLAIDRGQYRCYLIFGKDFGEVSELIGAEITRGSLPLHAQPIALDDEDGGWVAVLINPTLQNTAGLDTIDLEDLIDQ